MLLCSSATEPLFCDCSTFRCALFPLARFRTSFSATSHKQRLFCILSNRLQTMNRLTYQRTLESLRAGHQVWSLLRYTLAYFGCWATFDSALPIFRKIAQLYFAVYPKYEYGVTCLEGCALELSCRAVPYPSMPSSLPAR